MKQTGKTQVMQKSCDSGGIFCRSHSCRKNMKIFRCCPRPARAAPKNFHVFSAAAAPAKNSSRITTFLHDLGLASLFHMSRSQMGITDLI